MIYYRSGDKTHGRAFSDLWPAARENDAEDDGKETRRDQLRNDADDHGQCFWLCIAEILRRGAARPPPVACSDRQTTSTTKQIQRLVFGEEGKELAEDGEEKP